MTNQDEREERADRLRERFEDGPAADGSTTDESQSTPSETDMTEESGDPMSGGSEGAVKDRPSVLMYLPEEIRQELDIRFDELNAQHKRQYGEALEKNRDYYPAVVEAGLTDKDLKEILDL
ncbi:hypothetical protein [Halorubrum distributum]|jgi:hypothetical protein|nr:hypothetical protein [Halorubrum terrestre]